jgi:hypothetical protein
VGLDDYAAHFLPKIPVSNPTGINDSGLIVGFTGINGNTAANSFVGTADRAARLRHAPAGSRHRIFDA